MAAIELPTDPVCDCVQKILNMTGRRLEGKVALVTGASRGIGAAVACALAREGAAVALGGRDQDALMRVQDEIIRVLGGRAFYLVTDVTIASDTQALAREAEKKFGRVNILVNAAGVMYYTLTKNILTDQWSEMVDVNCKGVLNSIAAVLPDMVNCNEGHIVNISSDAAKEVFPALTVYSASKHFVRAVSHGLRKELVGTGVRVTDVQPGDTATALTLHSNDLEALNNVGIPEGEPVGASSTRNQVLDVDDVASAVLYAITAPVHVGVHEILIEPKDQA